MNSFLARGPEVIFGVTADRFVTLVTTELGPMRRVMREFSSDKRNHVRD